MTAVRLVFAIVVAAASAFIIHVGYGRNWAAAYVKAQAVAGRLNDIAHEPYPFLSSSPRSRRRSFRWR